MAHDDMNHLKFLETVALSDCAVLEDKESTYQGSWKRAGGRSAWFMARRNLDRLITMMAPPSMDNANFAVSEFDRLRLSMEQNGHAIAHQTDMSGTFKIVMQMLSAEDLFMKIREKPSGEDGTVLACMRDARRYFMLVEAEMIAEGVVEPEANTYDSDNYPQDVYTLIANETGLPREEVKRRCHEACYSTPTLHHSPPIEQPTNGGPTPESGSHHASLAPWEIGPKYCATLVARVGQTLVDTFYARRTPEKWRLECVVSSEHCPREIKQCYDYTKVDGITRWVLRRGDLPEDLKFDYPLLQVEMNAFEHKISNDDFKFMYSEHGEKMILRQDYKDWAREA